ncbi:MAG: hypothetical protein ACP5E4_04325 [Candidatus Aenigmatarchaeota archaeon]
MEGKGALTVETVIILIACLIVLAIAIVFVIRGSQPGGEAAREGALRSECLKWQRYDCAYQKADESDSSIVVFDGDKFNPEKYPALWKEYGSDCLDEYGKFKEDCPTAESVGQQAKNFCTMSGALG